MHLFLSYRRDDSEGFAGWLADLLRSPAEDAPPDEVFLDVDDIAPGRNFVRDMLAAVGRADAVLVMIGRRWLRPSLQRPEDPVRLEIEAAFDARLPVYCVLVDGAAAPGPRDLPTSLEPLTRTPAVSLREADFAADAHRLRQRLAADVRPTSRGRTATTATLEVFHANAGFWTEGSSFNVVLDGTALGTVMANTPANRFDVAPGRHKVQCRRGLRRSEVVEIDLAPGGRARVEVTLALTGGLECRVAPP